MTSQETGWMNRHHLTIAVPDNQMLSIDLQVFKALTFNYDLSASAQTGHVEHKDARVPAIASCCYHRPAQPIEELLMFPRSALPLHGTLLQPACKPLLHQPQFRYDGLISDLDAASLHGWSR